MSGSSESVRWNACVHRLDLGLYSHPKEFGGMESEPMLIPREKSPLPEKISPQQDRTCDAASAGQRAQHTTYELFRPPLLIFNTYGVITSLAKSIKKVLVAFFSGLIELFVQL